MNRQRFDGLALDPARTSALDERAPAARGLVESPRTPIGDGQRAQRIGRDERRAAAARGRRQRDGALVRADRALLGAGPRVDMAERQGLARVLGVVGPAAHGLEQPRREAGERDEIEAVVFEDAGERLRVARSDELEVAVGNLEPRARRPCARRRGSAVRARRASSRPLSRIAAPGAARRCAADATRSTRGDGRDTASRAPARRTTCR